MTRLALLAAAAVLSLSSAASARDTYSTQCSRGYGTFACQTVRDRVEPPSAAELAEAASERAARIEAWERFCKPTIVQGTDGVSRYVYAAKGCDLGRSQ